MDGAVFSASRYAMEPAALQRRLAAFSRPESAPRAPESAPGFPQVRCRFWPRGHKGHQIWEFRQYAPKIIYKCQQTVL